VPFALVQLSHSLFERNFFNPVFVGVFLVRHLVHNKNRVTAFVVNRLEKRHRRENWIERKRNVLFFHFKRFCNFFNVRFALVFTYEFFFKLKRLVGSVAERTRYAHGLIVAQIPPKFAYNHRYGIGWKLHIQRCVKVIQRLDKPYAPHLKQIVHVFTAVVKSLYHR